MIEYEEDRAIREMTLVGCGCFLFVVWTVFLVLAALAAWFYWLRS